MSKQPPNPPARSRKRRIIEASIALLPILALAGLALMVAAAATIVAAPADTVSARARALERTVEAGRRAQSTLASLAGATVRDTRALESVLELELAEMRQAAAVAESPSLVARVAAIGARPSPEALGLVVAEAESERLATALGERRRTESASLRTAAVFAAAGLAALAIVAAVLPSVIATRRFVDANLKRWHPRDTIEERILKTNGQFTHLVMLTNRQFGDQVEKAASLADLERALDERVTAEANLREQVLAHRDEIEALKVESLRDPMTGVLSYKYMIARLLQSIEDFIVRGEPFVLLALDLDDFKLINDLHSHSLGDLALVRFARLLVDHAGDGRIVFRKSGDEFYVLMPGAAKGDGEELAAWLLEVVNGTEVEIVDASGRDRTEIATSIGVLDCLEMDRAHLGDLGDDDRFLQTLSWADAALQRAKTSGKGCQKSYTTGMTRVNADEYPPMLDAVTRAVPVRYPGLPAESKTRFNVLVESLVELVLPKR